MKRKELLSEIKNGRKDFHGDDLFDYCWAKQNAYEEKVHAANLEERLPKAVLVEDQK